MLVVVEVVVLVCKWVLVALVERAEVEVLVVVLALEGGTQSSVQQVWVPELVWVKVSALACKLGPELSSVLVAVQA